MQIQGIEGMTTGQVQFELQRGAKFVFYYYCVSLLVITFRRPSGIYFLRAGESAVVKSLPWTLPGAVNCEFKSTLPRWMLPLLVTETGMYRIPPIFHAKVGFMAKLSKFVHKLPVARRSRPGA